MRAEQTYSTLVRRESYIVIFGLLLHLVLIWLLLYSTGYLLNGWWLGVLGFGLIGYILLRDYYLQHKNTEMLLYFKSRDYFASEFIKDMANFGFVSQQVSLTKFVLKADVLPVLKFSQYQFPSEIWSRVMLEIGDASASLVGPKETLRLIRIYVLKNRTPILLIHATNIALPYR